MDKAVLDKQLEILDSLTPAKEACLAKREAKALVIDLSNESSYDWPIPQVYVDSYVSGPALAARLWATFVGPEIDNPASYETDNPVVFTASALSNLHVPGGENVGCAFRSPVTESLIVNSVTNSIGMRLSSLGYAALVLLGRLRRPTIVRVRQNGVLFNTSESFIGYTVSQVEELFGSKPMTTIMSIGPAGEQKVPFSTVVCEGAAICRGGLGAVFGFKNIKAICVTGLALDSKTNAESGKELASDPDWDALKAKTSEKINKACSDSFYDVDKLIEKAKVYGWAPVSNFRRRTDPRLFHLSGEELVRRFGKEHVGCVNCPILCKHVSSDGFVLPDYQVLLMLGSNVECFDVNSIMVRYALCLDMGLDPISTGNVLGWALQAREVGLFTALGKDFDFANNDNVLPLIEMIAKRVGQGEPLSFGVKALGKAYEDSSFAYEIRGLECGPYDYRSAFAQAVSDTMGFEFPNQFEVLSRLCKKNPALWAVYNESLTLGLTSYGLSPALIVPVMVKGKKTIKFACETIPSLAIKLLKPKLFADLISSSIKAPVFYDDILNLGDLCWLLIYSINNSMGYNMLEACFNLLPVHFSSDPDSNSPDKTVVPSFELFQRYCLLRKKGILSKLSKLNSERS